MASAMIVQKKKPKLLRYFGFFRCKNCNNSWQSVHVYCDPMTLKVKYKQKCKRCKHFYDPYKIEPIKCSRCGHVKDKCQCCYIPSRRPGTFHRQDLCGKCLEGKKPCDSVSYPNGVSTKDDEVDDEDDDDDYNDDNYDDDDYEEDGDEDEGIDDGIYNAEEKLLFRKYYKTSNYNDYYKNSNHNEYDYDENDNDSDDVYYDDSDSYIQ